MLETGDVIKYLRKQRGMTQDDLAEALGVQKTTIQKYEANTVKNLKLQTIRQLCVLFNAPPWYFIFPEQTIHSAVNEKDFLVKQALCIVKYYSLLNPEGRNRLFQYIEEIAEIEKYRTTDTQKFQVEHELLVKTILLRQSPENNRG